MTSQIVVVHAVALCTQTHPVNIPQNVTIDVYDMIFIYCNWVSIRWQWSVDLYKTGKTQRKMRNSTENNTKTWNTQNRKRT